MGFRVFWKGGGVPLPLNKGVFDTSDFDVDTTRETLAKNDPKCRREFETKAGHEPAEMSHIFETISETLTQLFLEMSNTLIH